MQCEREPRYAADRYMADRYQYKIIHPSCWPRFFVPPFSLISSFLFVRAMPCDGRVRESELLGSGRPSFSLNDRHFYTDKTRMFSSTILVLKLWCRKFFVFLTASKNILTPKISRNYGIHVRTQVVVVIE